LVGLATSDNPGVFLADPIPGRGVDVPADTGDLRNTGEVNTGGVGDPGRPLADLPASAFGDYMIRITAQQRMTLLKYRLQQLRLVTLDGHDVIETPYTLDVFGGLALGVRGVHRNYHMLVGRGGHLVRHRHLQQRLDLGDLVRVSRNQHLTHRHRLTMDHRREQRELAILISPGTLENLPVQRQHQPTLGVPSRVRPQPRPRNPIQLSSVDTLQHPTNRALTRIPDTTPKITPRPT